MQGAVWVQMYELLARGLSGIDNQARRSYFKGCFFVKIRLLGEPRRGFWRKTGLKEQGWRRVNLFRTGSLTVEHRSLSLARRYVVSLLTGASVSPCS